MKFINLSQGKRALVDDEDFEYLNKFKWCYTNPYAGRNIKVNGKIKRILMHRIIIKAQKGQIVDHINFHELDNRKSNLRICDYTQSNIHKRLQSNNTSGYPGIYFRKDTKRWTAELWYKKKKIGLGTYNSKEEAFKAYQAKAYEIHGEFFMTLEQRRMKYTSREQAWNNAVAIWCSQNSYHPAQANFEVMMAEIKELAEKIAPYQSNFINNK